MRIFHIQLDFATIVHIEERQAYKNVKNALNLKLKLVQKANNTTDQQKYKFTLLSFLNYLSECLHNSKNIMVY